ncbi:hypothetical protein PQU92_01690 [Asticcacaulis sp. BYS171W]|uniref:Uncharacterized protein n=1 Tax=Asticcacaulis aquaticus TaxID=2984212 RepID=A0ABT5HPH9_9CAUL|nr:DUF6559 family protein [Asticcacaulis aquaticus]MDC7681970.1 hypothetical protein [Asticcacaulis aquaticus]
MGWFERFRLRRAARRYARYVPAALRKGWGKSEFYTVGQVEAVLTSLDVSGSFKDIARAAFLTQEDYHLSQDSRAGLSYADARSLFHEMQAKLPYAYGRYEFEAMENVQAARQYGVGDR